MIVMETSILQQGALEMSRFLRILSLRSKWSRPLYPCPFIGYGLAHWKATGLDRKAFFN